MRTISILLLTVAGGCKVVDAPETLEELVVFGFVNYDGDLAVREAFADGIRPHFEEFTEELEGLYPPKGLKAEYLMNGGKALGCSELMLQPMGALMKSASYAEALEEWVKTFPREQIKVINTDDLERGAQRIMNETFDHIGLPRVDVGTKSRFCVRGKQGVIDILKDEENKVRIGKNETLHEENVKVKIDDCDSDPAAAQCGRRSRS